ncbi:MAG: phosphonate transport system permease protein, partial [Verrucomicrobiales bacterium]
MPTRAEQIEQLRRTRPRDRFLRASLIGVALLVVYALIAGDFAFSDVFSSKRLANLERFWENLTTADEPGSPRAEVRAQLLSHSGEAVVTTLWLSVAAIVLAGVGASILCAFSARNLATPDPFIGSNRAPSPTRKLLWKSVVWFTRAILIVSRAIPEYIWAFLLIGLFGLGAWPAVLALALHNLGILGRLG